MGAGRKTKTYRLSEDLQSSSTVNCSTTARNLKKSELGGVIFGCKSHTFKQCFEMELFGLPAPHISYVKNICPGLPLFLFNYSDRKLYGIFEAASSGRLNINPHGWTEHSSDCSPFAAQVKFKTRIQCQPLLEDQFGPVIADNYYQPKLFWFELDQSQTNKLISLFSTSPVTASSFPPMGKPNKSATLSNSRKDGGGSEIPVSDLNFAKQEQSNIYRGSCSDGIDLSGPRKSSVYDGRSYSSLLKNDVHSIGNSKHAQTGQRPLDSNGLTGENGSCDAIDKKEASEQSMEISNLPAVDQLNNMLESLVIGSVFEGERDSWEDLINDSSHCDEQYECLKQQMEDLNASVATNGPLPQSIPCESQSTAFEASASECNTSEIENRCLHETDLLSNVISPDLHFIVDKMQQELHKLQLRQFKQEQKMCSLEKEVVESRREIKSLKQQSKTPECISFQENNLVIESESSVDESILIIGGYNGSSYLSALECFCPSHDLLETLCPMSSMRACTSTVKLNGEVYIIGGRGLDDNLWYDTVESYNLVENQWVTRPSLNQKKGSLAAISLNDKIFSMGGGNGKQCFSEVESFDPYVGKWIPTSFMLNKIMGSKFRYGLFACIDKIVNIYPPRRHKRFTPAAAEINGVIYVVGGFDGDGDHYLKSVERFDPRENSWSRLQNMSTPRGCHSLAVLNDKLYAIGGFNGATMISTVEIFDPRTRSWIMGESLNTSRGYFATVVVGNSIFVIGGLSENKEVLDTVECYKEGHGWQSTNLKAVGRRCFLSAVPLSG